MAPTRQLPCDGVAQTQEVVEAVTTKTGLDMVFKDVENFSDACYQHMSDKQMDESNLTEEGITAHGWIRTSFGWRRTAPITEGIGLSFPHIGLKSITIDNLEEWIYRSDSLFDAGLVIIAIINEPDSEMVPYFFTRQDITIHTNAYIASPPNHWPISDLDFDSYIRSLRMARQRNAKLQEKSVSSDTTPCDESATS